MSIRFCAILFLLICGSAALTAAQSETASLTYVETRELLLKMDPDLQGDTTQFKKLFEEFSESLKDADVDAWIAAADRWEADVTQDDPYFVKPSGTSQVSHIARY